MRKTIKKAYGRCSVVRTVSYRYIYIYTHIYTHSTTVTQRISRSLSHYLCCSVSRGRRVIKPADIVSSKREVLGTLPRVQLREKRTDNSLRARARVCAFFLFFFLQLGCTSTRPPVPSAIRTFAHMHMENFQKKNYL